MIDIALDFWCGIKAVVLVFSIFFLAPLAIGYVFFNFFTVFILLCVGVVIGCVWYIGWDIRKDYG